MQECRAGVEAIRFLLKLTTDKEWNPLAIYVQGRENPRPIPRPRLEIQIRVEDSYLGLQGFVFRVMDAISKYLGLGRGTNPLYIC